jgi:hypothetical protein
VTSGSSGSYSYSGSRILTKLRPYNINKETGAVKSSKVYLKMRNQDDRGILKPHSGEQLKIFTFGIVKPNTELKTILRKRGRKYQLE